MTVPFRRSQQRSEREKLTPERILHLAKRPQGFDVSWRWRDEWLMRRCIALKREGKLRRERGGRGSTTYFAIIPQANEGKPQC